MKIAGRAMTVVECDLDHGDPCFASRPFGLMFRALDDLGPGDVYICSGSSHSYALWGELMSAAARSRGAVGAVVHGFSRDTHGILAQNFPVFSTGRYAQDQRPRGHVTDFRCGLTIGSVRISDGDIVVGDLDGVCIIPKDNAKEIVAAALEKVSAERTVFNAVTGGMGAQAAFDKFGIL
jgi:regulator of RNase E activity RraA